MKKFTLIMMVICISVMAMAQSKYAKMPVQSMPAKAIKNQMMPAQSANPITNSKAVLEDVIGTTYYDMQTNGAIDTRITVYPDGTMGGVWTRGTANSSERGTGYNYNNGTSWEPAPTVRIENDRTGWPSYAPLGPTGEIVIAHLNDGLKVSKRTVKGQGTWDQSVIMGPAGATDISWPRIMTNGPSNNYIHMITSTYVAYQGLDLAYLYYRSLDGGLTWDKNGVILPQMTSADYDGFNGDEIAWGTPHGDTIYFMISGPWVDTFIMTSSDNGDNWTKIPILSNANKKLPSGTTEVAPFTMSDGSCAVEMDKSGVLHAAFGIGGGYMTGSTKYIYVNMNGLVYWNSTMPMVKDSLDLATLEADGQLVGWVSDGPGPGDTIVAAPSYRVGLTSFPQISVDDWNNIYFLWSAVAPGNPDPTPLNYRHLNGRAKFHDKSQMTDIVDFNPGFMYIFSEYVYPSMAKNIMNDKLAVIYQTSGWPGSNLVDPLIPSHECNMEYREIPGSAFWPTGIEKNPATKIDPVSLNFPNPVQSVTRFNVTLDKPANVIIEVSNVMGQKIMSMDKGLVNAGVQQYTIDATQLAAGVYFYSVKINSENKCWFSTGVK
jgi:hypothetical protein